MLEKPSTNNTQAEWSGAAMVNWMMNQQTALLPGWCTLDELYTCAPLIIRQVFVIKGTEHLWCFQKPVFLLGVSQHMHKITNLWAFILNWCFQMPYFSHNDIIIIIFVYNEQLSFSCYKYVCMLKMCCTNSVVPLSVSFYLTPAQISYNGDWQKCLGIFYLPFHLQTQMLGLNL